MYKFNIPPEGAVPMASKALIRRMKKSLVKKCGIGWVVLLLSSCAAGCFNPLIQQQTGSLVIMSYNVENLFDDVSHGTEYEGYDPAGGIWNSELYHKKLNNIADVIIAAVEGGPDILALQEIENQNVIDDLNQRYLNNLGYSHTVMAESPSAAFDVAVLSRHPVVSTRSHNVVVEGYYNRAILEVKIEINGKHIYLFNNHWRSKFSGEESTEIHRRTAALSLRKRIAELQAAEKSEYIIIAGDLNENYDEFCRVEQAYPTALVKKHYRPLLENERKVLFITGDTDKVTTLEEVPIFFSPWAHGPPHAGSYLFQDRWNTIDHFLLSCGFFNPQKFSYEGFEVYADESILTAAGAPKRWITSYGSGFSDHLPIILYLAIE